MRRIVTAVVAFALSLAAAYAYWSWAGRPVVLVDAPGGRFPCLSYAPYQGNQTPYDKRLMIPSAQIEADLRLLAQYTGCIRTYETGHGMTAVVPIAAELGLHVMLGAWIGDNAEGNVREIAEAVSLANRYPETVKALIAGNEVLLRGEYSPEGLKRVIRDIRAQVPVPVTYADLWSVWDKYPDVADAVDFLTIHTLHYWDNSTKPVDEAAKDSLAIAKRLAAAHPGKRVFIGEAGWPSTGRMRQQAEPSLLNQARYVRQLIVAAGDAGTGLNIIEAFDQPWKRRPEGTVGGFWGVFDADREAKFPLTGPVRDDPDWRRHFLIAAVIGAIPLVFGLFARQRPGVAVWLLLAGVGKIAGSGLVLAGLQGWDASYNPIVGLVWAGRWLLALSALLLFPPVLLRLSADEALRPLPMLALLARLRQRQGFADRLAAAFGLVRGLTLFTAAATMLCFVFDGRHRDYPLPAYGVVAIILLVLALVARWTAVAAGTAPPQRDLAEERLLAVVLVAGSVASPLIEGFGNWQTLAWVAISLMLALAVQLDSGWSGRPRVGQAQSSGRNSRNPASSNPAADSSGA